MSEAKKWKHRGFSKQKEELKIELSGCMSSTKFILENSRLLTPLVLKQQKIVDGGIVIHYSATQREMNIEGVGFPVIKDNKIFVGLVSFGNSEIHEKQRKVPC